MDILRKIDPTKELPPNGVQIIFKPKDRDLASGKLYNGNKIRSDGYNYHNDTNYDLSGIEYWLKEI